jgi:hypothetical protein
LDIATPIFILDGAEWAGIVPRAIAIMAITGRKKFVSFIFKGRRNDCTLENSDESGQVPTRISRSIQIRRREQSSRMALLGS